MLELIPTEIKKIESLPRVKNMIKGWKQKYVYPELGEYICDNGSL